MTPYGVSRHAEDRPYAHEEDKDAVRLLLPDVEECVEQPVQKQRMYMLSGVASCRTLVVRAIAGAE
eukprot:47295-Eustigmatos_ZCMA.PRE.1